MKHCLLKSVGLLLLCSLFTQVNAQKVNVYFLEDEFCPGANVTFISSNGKYVVGHSSDVSHTAFIWSLETRKSEQILGSKDSLALAFAVTNEGLVAGAFQDSTQYTSDGRKGCPMPGSWKEGRWMALPLMENINLSGDWLDGFACSISADGKTITGTIQHATGKYTPAVWKEGVLQDMVFEDVDEGQGGYCYAASDDAKVVGGWAELENGSRGPAVWIDGKIKRVLGEKPDEVYFFDGQIRGISPNGKYATGYFSLDGTGGDAYPFIWSEETGVVKYTNSGVSSTVSNSGNVYGATGYMGNGTIYHDGVQYELTDYLKEKYNFDPSGLKYSLGTVMAVSEDEHIIGGWTIGGMVGGMPLMTPYIVVIENESDIVEPVASEFGVRLSPNPVNDRLLIDGEFDLASIYNSVGAEVISNVRSNSVDMSSFNQGVYFVKVTSGSFNKTFKIIKN